MLTINKNLTAIESEELETALAALQEEAMKQEEIAAELAAANQRDNDARIALESMSSRRKEALLKSAGRVTQEIIDIRNERKEREIELEEIADVKSVLEELIDAQQPKLYQLSAAAFKARERIGRKVAHELGARKIELVKELGSIVSLEIAVESLGTPFDAANFSRFGDGSPLEVLDTTVSKLASSIKAAAERGEGVAQVLGVAGVKDVPTGSLDKARIGSPLAGRIKKKA